MTTSSLVQKKHKVTVVGSGNWGCTIAKIIAENCAEQPDIFEKEVQMWVYEENITLPATSPYYDEKIGETPQKLASIINNYHENVKYLPGIKLPSNLVANPSVQDAVKDSTILIFNLPHQFIDKACRDLTGHILPFARGISCIKGVNLTDDGIHLFSESIGKGLNIYCGALSGANLASEIAQEKWSETTIAYAPPPLDTPSGSKSGESESDDDELYHKDASGKKSSVTLTPIPAEYAPITQTTFKKLFHRPYFHVRTVSDVAGVSLSGALKNVVALAAGFVEGRGWGDNAKAAIMRVGLLEMVKFGQAFFSTADRATFTDESAGVADLITSCCGGRNYRCAKMAVQEGLTVKEVEARELNGQMLQGTSTALEVHSFLKIRGVEAEYPLFTAIAGILEGKHSVDEIPDLISDN
ncbi:hypothetical protein BROUX41_002887 [Berkeleyomyces rouxiae]